MSGNKRQRAGLDADEAKAAVEGLRASTVQIASLVQATDSAEQAMQLTKEVANLLSAVQALEKGLAERTPLQVLRRENEELRALRDETAQVLKGFADLVEDWPANGGPGASS